MSLSSSTLKQQADQDLVVFAGAAMRAIRPENPDDVRILLADIVSRYSRTSRDGAMRSILRDLRRHFDLDAFVDAAWLNEQLDPPAAAPTASAAAPPSPRPAAASPSPPPAALFPASPAPPPPNTTRAPTRGNVGATERARALANSDLSLGSSRRRRQASPAFDEETLEQAKARERAEGYQAPTMTIDSDSDSESSNAKPPAKRPRPGNSNTEIDKKKAERAAGPSKKALKGRQKDWRYVCDVKGCITTALGAGDFQFHMRSKHNRRNGWKIHWANPPEDMFWIAKDEDDEIYTGEMRRA
ncbi:hypothetical protein LTR96_010065 [Exophiala xenobiotica]|nr:hypothetical protein LTR96_010065 [Exophiala xenobiotica]KAK5333597.1 hypothetical protein LTR98_010297 [Exophiala xenobiotica]